MERNLRNIFDWGRMNSQAVSNYYWGEFKKQEKGVCQFQGGYGRNKWGRLHSDGVGTEYRNQRRIQRERIEKEDLHMQNLGETLKETNKFRGERIKEFGKRLNKKLKSTPNKGWKEEQERVHTIQANQCLIKKELFWSKEMGSTMESY